MSIKKNKQTKQQQQQYYYIHLNFALNKIFEYGTAVKKHSSTYHLFLFPGFHSGFVFFKFVAPVGVNLLIVGAFVWRCASKPLLKSHCKCQLKMYQAIERKKIIITANQIMIEQNQVFEMHVSAIIPVGVNGDAVTAQ